MITGDSRPGGRTAPEVQPVSHGAPPRLFFMRARLVRALGVMLAPLEGNIDLGFVLIVQSVFASVAFPEQVGETLPRGSRSFPLLTEPPRSVGAAFSL